MPACKLIFADRLTYSHTLNVFSLVWILSLSQSHYPSSELSLMVIEGNITPPSNSSKLPHSNHHSISHQSRDSCARQRNDRQQACPWFTQPLLFSVITLGFGQVRTSWCLLKHNFRQICRVHTSCRLWQVYKRLLCTVPTRATPLARTRISLRLAC